MNKLNNAVAWLALLLNMVDARGIIGLLARAVFWICAWDIVVNAVTQAIGAHQYIFAVIELGAFPATYLLYPFLQPTVGNAWPWAGGHTLIPVLVLSLIAYPISTLVGGLKPVDR